MVLDIDVYRSAHLLMRQHGEDAELVAGTRADELLEAGDLNGHGVFVRIVAAIRELKRRTPKPGETVQ
jgi:hypothetical protein